MARFILIGMMIVAVGSLLADETAAAPSKLTDVQKYQVRNAITILKNLGNSDMTMEKQFDMVFAPIAKANQNEMKRNRKTVESLVRKSQDIQKKSPSKAKEYVRVAKAYKAYADANLAVIEAYRNRDDKEMTETIARLVAIEGQIEKITGSRPRRTWFTPDELEDVAMAEAARRQAARRQ